MATEAPITTAFYISIITGLTIGYGDFSPTSEAGQGMFIIFMPFSIAVLLESLHEINEVVLAARTTIKVEVVNILEIMDMDNSGEGKIDIN